MAASRSFASGGQWRSLTGAALNITKPSPPFITSTSFVNNALEVTISPPISNGGASITSYTVRAVPVGGGVPQQVSGTGPTLSLQSLIGGTTYTITAFATNTAGNGTASSGVNVVAPTVTYVKPLAYNTGYPHGLPGDTRTPQTLTPVSGADFETLIQNTSGDVTLTGYEVTGPFNLRRNNMTFQSCLFVSIPSVTSDSGFPYVVAGGSPQPSKVTFIDCEFAGHGVTQNDPDGDLTLGWANSLPCNVEGQIHIRSDIWGFQDGFHAVTNARYESCYVHDLTHFYKPGGDDTHNDGFQFVGGANDFSVVGCNIDVVGGGTNAPVMQFNAGSDSERVTIADNWFNGGGYFMISGAPAADDVLSMVMANNKFGLTAGTIQIWYQDGGSWLNAVNDGRLTLINNTWEVSGTTSYGAVVTAGSPIPGPN